MDLARLRSGRLPSAPTDDRHTLACAGRTGNARLAPPQTRSSSNSGVSLATLGRLLSALRGSAMPSGPSPLRGRKQVGLAPGRAVLLHQDQQEAAGRRRGQCLGRPMASSTLVPALCLLAALGLLEIHKPRRTRRPHRDRIARGDLLLSTGVDGPRAALVYHLCYLIRSGDVAIEVRPSWAATISTVYEPFGSALDSFSLFVPFLPGPANETTVRLPRRT